MKYISRLVLFSTVLLTFACSGASEVTTNNSSVSNSLYPTWYGSYEFSSDTTSFYARATAVASDADAAKLRAEKEARVLLESYIAEELEGIRSELERDGSSIVKEPNFILKLRNAHYKVEEQAKLSNAESITTEGVHRGFAKVEITKQKVKSLLRQGFSGNETFWNTLSSSQTFMEL